MVEEDQMGRKRIDKDQNIIRWNRIESNRIDPIDDFNSVGYRISLFYRQIQQKSVIVALCISDNSSSISNRLRLSKIRTYREIMDGQIDNHIIEIDRKTCYHVS